MTNTVESLTAKLRTLDQQIERLIDMVEHGEGTVASLATRLQKRQTEREALVAAIAAASTVRQVALDREAIRQQILKQAARWRLVVY